MINESNFDFEFSNIHASSMCLQFTFMKKWLYGIFWILVNNTYVETYNNNNNNPIDDNDDDKIIATNSNKKQSEMNIEHWINCIYVLPKKVVSMCRKFHQTIWTKWFAQRLFQQSKIHSVRSSMKAFIFEHQNGDKISNEKATTTTKIGTNEKKKTSNKIP